MMLLPPVFYLILADVFAIVCVTDVIATTYCNVDLLAHVIASGDVLLIVALGHFLCPMADVIATSWLILFGRCYSQVAGIVATANVSSCLADVIVKMVDGIPTMGVVWQMLQPKWQMDSHWVNVLISILMSCVGPHPIYEADGTCLYL